MTNSLMKSSHVTALGLHNDNFVSCPTEALQWPTRRYRMLEEIVEYSPDIICLQVLKPNLTIRSRVNYFSP